MSGEHCFDGVLVRIDVEGALLVEVLQQVDGSQVARRVIDVHVFATWVRSVNAAARMRGVPLVDRGVELQTGVGTIP